MATQPPVIDVVKINRGRIESLERQFNELAKDLGGTLFRLNQRMSELEARVNTLKTALSELRIKMDSLRNDAVRG